MGAIAIAALHVMGILFYFGIFYLAGLAHWMVLKRITKEVPPDSQNSTAAMMVSHPPGSSTANNFGHVSAVLPRELPSWLCLATWVLMIVFFVLCVQFDRSHSVAHPELLKYRHFTL